MAKGDGRGGNHGGSGNGAQPAHDIGPADIELGRLILLAREGNRQAVREALEKITKAEKVLARAAICVERGALQSAIGVLEREFDRVFAGSSDGDGEAMVRVPQSEKGGGYWKTNKGNTPIAELDLPVRIVNTLENDFGALYVDQLCKFSAAELRSGRRGGGIGAAGLKQIRKALTATGRVLRGELTGALSHDDDDGDCNELGSGDSEL